MKGSHVLLLVGGILLVLVVGFFAVVAFVCSATQSAVEHAAAGAAPLVASAGNGPMPAAPSTTDSTTPPPEASATTSRTLAQLEARLRDGRVHAEGPGADVLAAELQSVIDADYGDAMAIHVAPGRPERVVVLLRLSDLRDQGSLDRRKWLDDVGETLEWGFGSDGLLAVGIRGPFAYGGVAVRMPGAERWTHDIGARVSTAPLQAALAAPPAPAPATGQDLHVDHYGFLEGPSRQRAQAVPLTLEAGVPVHVGLAAPWGDPTLRVDDPSGAPLDLALGEGVFETAEEAFLMPRVTGTYTFRVQTDASEGHLPFALRLRPPPSELRELFEELDDEAR